MDPIVVGVFPRNRTQVVAGEISEFNDTVHAHIRVLAMTVDGGLAHTRKGVSMPLNCVPAVRDAIHKLADVIGPGRTTGVIDVGREQIRVGTVLFNDLMYLDVRRYFEKGGEWHPTSKGVMVRPQYVDQLIKLADELAVAAASIESGSAS